MVVVIKMAYKRFADRRRQGLKSTYLSARTNLIKCLELSATTETCFCPYCYKPLLAVRAWFHKGIKFKTNKMKLAQISTLETEELACHITGLDYDEIDAEIIDEKLQEEFGCDLRQFTHIIQRLIPMIDVGSSLLTQKRYKGFSDIKKGMWFVKIEVGS